MKRLTCSMLAVLVLMVGRVAPARATSVEIPLSELVGSYNSATRQTTFRFDRLPVEIYGVSIKLLGRTDPGWSECWGLVTITWRTEFTATMADSTTGGVWRAVSIIGDLVIGNPAPFDFEVTIPFLPTDEASWHFLEAGRGTLVLAGFPEMIGGGGMDCSYVPPRTDIYGAILIVDGDFQIGTDFSTWGSIKALFFR